MEYGFAYNLHDRWNENYYGDDYSGGGNYYGLVIAIATHILDLLEIR